VIRHRLETFDLETAPIINFYRALSNAPNSQLKLIELDIKGGFDRMAPEFEAAVKGVVLEK
jgi:hypothetical protein